MPFLKRFPKNIHINIVVSIVLITNDNVHMCICAYWLFQIIKHQAQFLRNESMAKRCLRWVTSAGDLLADPRCREPEPERKRQSKTFQGDDDDEEEDEGEDDKDSNGSNWSDDAEQAILRADYGE